MFCDWHLWRSTPAAEEKWPRPTKPASCARNLDPTLPSSPQVFGRVAYLVILSENAPNRAHLSGRTCGCPPWAKLGQKPTTRRASSPLATPSLPAPPTWLSAAQSSKPPTLPERPPKSCVKWIVSASPTH